jgi:hypothetical protein
MRPEVTYRACGPIGSSQRLRDRAAAARYDASVRSLPPSELTGLLSSGESLIACVAVDGFHASRHSRQALNPHVAVTDQRIILFSRRGMMTKRLSEEASWPLTRFTERLNSNEGKALGPFLFFVSLFVDDEETVSTGFRSRQDREEFKKVVVSALGPVLG